MPHVFDLGLNMGYLSLILYAIVACITPGPNNTMILAPGRNFGVRAIVPYLLGINIGFLFWSLPLVPVAARCS